MMRWLEIIAAVAVVAVIAAVGYCHKSRRPKQFPPGPSPIPLLGNLHQVPSSKPFLQFKEWSREYGDIIGLKFGSQNVVVLNNYQDVRELFDRRGSIYSSRAYGYIPCELVCPNNVHILFMPNEPDLRRARTAMHQLLGPHVVDQLLPIQEAESAQLMAGLLQDPWNFSEHFQRWGVAVLLIAVYGQRGTAQDKDMVKDFFEVQKAWAALLEPGATPPVDLFPFLRHVPERFAGWKRTARHIRRKHRALYFGLLKKSRQELDKGPIGDCLMAKILRGQGTTGFTDEQIAYLGGFLLEAGSDTTSTTALIFLLALAAYPGVLKKAQQEVDNVCGSSRAPRCGDIAELPYLKACLMEVLRWRPTLPSGVPHVLDGDDTYHGFRIPKGTLVIANTWGIHHNAEEFDAPSEFNPDRFLDNALGAKAQVPISERRPTYAFGSGRRICPGDRFAENSILLALGKLVWAFDVVAGEKLDTSVETGFLAGLAIMPKPFKVDFIPRSKEKSEIVLQEYRSSEEFLGRFGS